MPLKERLRILAVAWPPTQLPNRPVEPTYDSPPTVIARSKPPREAPEENWYESNNKFN
jgi:hypothetical protein